jgi:hypothetical protein
MSDEITAIQTKSRMRSPAYPSFGLGEAIRKAELIWDALRKNDGHLDSVIHAMGYNGANGASLRAVGAMNHYGMFVESGGKGNRRIRLSELAQDILHLPDNDEKRAIALRAAALSPTIHEALWERYQQTLPKDDVLKGYLVREKNYSPEAATDVIKYYRDSFALAGLGDVTPDKLESSSDASPSPDKVDPKEARLPVPNLPAVHNPPLVLPLTSMQELPILVDNGQVARIPFPMSEEAYDLLLGTLQLWKKRLISQPVSNSSENSNSTSFRE